MTAVDNDEHNFLGTHILGEMYGIDAELLDNMDVLGQALNQGIEKKAERRFVICSPSSLNRRASPCLHCCRSHTPRFTHTQTKALFFDAFTCGRRCQPMRIADARRGPEALA